MTTYLLEVLEVDQTGSGGITKIGTGTLGLSGTNNGYTGATIVTEGFFQTSRKYFFKWIASRHGNNRHCYFRSQ